jgi:tripartite-type tricarboxylate transporter receptor subunit TctC
VNRISISFAAVFLLFMAISMQLAGYATAQDYPSRTITIIVPFPAGGSTDAIARILSEHMQASLGQSVIIENAGGAGGSVGVGRVARASPDGYTLDIGQWDTHVLNGVIYSLSYDVVKDFDPVALISANPFLILSKKGVPAKDLKGLIAWLKENPDKASLAVPTAGQRVAGVLFRKKPTPASSSCRIAAADQRCRIWWVDIST